MIHWGEKIFSIFWNYHLIDLFFVWNLACDSKHCLKILYMWKDHLSNYATWFKLPHVIISISYILLPTKKFLLYHKNIILKLWSIKSQWIRTTSCKRRRRKNQQLKMNTTFIFEQKTKLYLNSRWMEY